MKVILVISVVFNLVLIYLLQKQNEVCSGYRMLANQMADELEEVERKLQKYESNIST